ncbi:helix-turn-helix domain-containing protein [Haladaptatus sp. NG-SE-30]
MNLIAEFDVRTPIFEETRQAIDGLETEIEDVQLPAGQLPKLICWVSSDDFDTFEDVLPTDSTVESIEVLATSSDRRLYRVTLSEAGRDELMYPVAVEHDITFLEVRGSDRGTQISARIPDREALFSFHTELKERDFSFRLKRIYRADTVSDRPYGLTDRQREVLLFALDAGYFDVPRRTSLEELAAEFDISDQALSTLFRRGQANLLRHTLASRSST